MDVAQKIIALTMLPGAVALVDPPSETQRLHWANYAAVEDQRESRRESEPDPRSSKAVKQKQVASGVEQGLAPNTVETAINTTVADIARNPQGYDGRNVAVASKVEEIYSPWSIRLDEHQLFSGGVDNDILVVAVEPLAFAGFEQGWKGRNVHVIGTVRILHGDDFRRQYGRGLDDELFRQFAGKPVIIAQSITPLE